MSADPRMADWSGPNDETYFAEQAKRRMLREVPIERHRLAREDPAGEAGAVVDLAALEAEAAIQAGVDVAREQLAHQAERDAIGIDATDPLPDFLSGQREPAIGPDTLSPEADVPSGRKQSAEPEAAAPIIGLPLAEFLAEAAAGVAYLADGAIVDGGLVVFVGRPETFKTMALLDLGLATAGAASSWLGLGLGPARPFVYVSNEKSPATVRERFRRMTHGRPPTEPVHVIHRRSVTFGDRASWDAVLAVVESFGRPCVVGCDTLASLAAAGFDENSGRDMAVALAALRRLTDTGATVLLGHHPAKHGEGTGGIRMRGHTSLWGEVDGTLEFTRPDRAAEAGMIRVEPKDGDLRLMHFRWDRQTFLLEPETAYLVMTAMTIASVVDALYDGTALSSDRIGAEFPGHGRTVLLDRLREAVDAGLIARVGRARSTGYVPIPRVMRPDDTDSGDPLEHASAEANRPPIVRESSGADAGRHETIVRPVAVSSAYRPGTGQGGESIVRGRGSSRPSPDDSPPDDSAADEDEPEDVDAAIELAFPVPPGATPWAN